ncbi:hypothetical protein GCM10017784_19230 [Deinococcus indicus]|uniref:hypothetical protein n=1 Tax=Deinococcus indicus TaxID=223556 RepID=UPI00174D1BC2|nr:hypothetical protein [Deinococcus indicus]GHG26960.1 hypothetical protein GCM10017784_19230 [Deinococcus indicus]
MTRRAGPLAHLLFTLLLGGVPAWAAPATPPVTALPAAPLSVTALPAAPLSVTALPAAPLSVTAPPNAAPPGAPDCVSVPVAEQLPVELTDGRAVLGEALAAQLGDQLLILATDAPLISLLSDCPPGLFTPLTVPAQLDAENLTLTVQPGAAFYGDQHSGDQALPAQPAGGAVLHSSVTVQTTRPGDLSVSAALNLEAQLPGGAGVVAAVSGALPLSSPDPVPEAVGPDAASPVGASPVGGGQVGAGYVFLRRPDAAGGTWEVRGGLLPGLDGGAPGFSVQRRAPQPPLPDVWIESATPATYVLRIGEAVLTAGTVPAGRTQLRDLPFPAVAGTATLSVTDAAGTREQRLSFDARAGRRTPGEIEGRVEYRRTTRHEWDTQLRWTASEVEYSVDAGLGAQDRLGLSAQGAVTAAGQPVTLNGRVTAVRDGSGPTLTTEAGVQGGPGNVQFGARAQGSWTPGGLERWQVQASAGWQGPWGAAQAQIAGGHGSAGAELSASARTALPREWLPAGWSARLGVTAARTGGQVTGQLLLTLSRSQPDLTVESSVRREGNDGKRTPVLSVQGPLYLPDWNASYRADILPDPAVTVRASGPVSLRLSGTLGPPGTLAAALGTTLALTPTPALLPAGFSGLLRVQVGQPGVPLSANGASVTSDAGGVAHLPFLLGQEFLTVSVEIDRLPLGITARRDRVRVRLGSATVQSVDLSGDLRREPLRRLPVPPEATVTLRGQPVTRLGGGFVHAPDARDGDPLLVTLPGGEQRTCVWGPAEELPCR